MFFSQAVTIEIMQCKSIVFYKFCQHNFTVNYPGVKAKDIIVTVDPSEGDLSRSDSIFTIFAKTSSANITLKITTKSKSKSNPTMVTVPVKKLGMPSLEFDGIKTPCVISRSHLSSVIGRGLDAKFNIDCESSWSGFNIVSCEVYIDGKEYSYGERSSLEEAIKKCKGNKIVYNNIKVRSTDGIISLPKAVITIK